MIGAKVIRESTSVGEQPEIVSDDTALLAAVLAATLVEYQRLVQQKNGHKRSEDAGSNWRMLGCFERLRGRA